MLGKVLLAATLGVLGSVSSAALDVGLSVVGVDVGVELGADGVGASVGDVISVDLGKGGGTDDPQPGAAPPSAPEPASTPTTESKPAEASDAAPPSQAAPSLGTEAASLSPRTEARGTGASSAYSFAGIDYSMVSLVDKPSAFPAGLPAPGSLELADFQRAAAADARLASFLAAYGVDLARLLGIALAPDGSATFYLLPLVTGGSADGGTASAEQDRTGGGRATKPMDASTPLSDDRIPSVMPRRSNMVAAPLAQPADPTDPDIADCVGASRFDLAGRLLEALFIPGQMPEMEDEIGSPDTFLTVPDAIAMVEANLQAYPDADYQVLLSYLVSATHAALDDPLYAEEPSPFAPDIEVMEAARCAREIVADMGVVSLESLRYAVAGR